MDGPFKGISGCTEFPLKVGEQRAAQDEKGGRCDAIHPRFGGFQNIRPHRETHEPKHGVDACHDERPNLRCFGEQTRQKHHDRCDGDDEERGGEAGHEKRKEKRGGDKLRDEHFVHGQVFFGGWKAG